MRLRAGPEPASQLEPFPAQRSARLTQPLRGGAPALPPPAPTQAERRTRRQLRPRANPAARATAAADASRARREPFPPRAAVGSLLGCSSRPIRASSEAAADAELLARADLVIERGGALPAPLELLLELAGDRLGGSAATKRRSALRALPSVPARDNLARERNSSLRTKSQVGAEARSSSSEASRDATSPRVRPPVPQPA